MNTNPKPNTQAMWIYCKNGSLSENRPVKIIRVSESGKRIQVEHTFPNGIREQRWVDPDNLILEDKGTS